MKTEIKTVAPVPATAPATSIAEIATNIAEIAKWSTAAITSNLSIGEMIEFSDLPRVTMPSGKNTAFSCASENHQEITGIIIAQSLNRVLYPESFEDSGGATPPVCTSTDGITGIQLDELSATLKKVADITGGECKTCAFSKFGSKAKAFGGKGKAQACSLRRDFVIRTNFNPLPVILSAPTGSLKTVKGYLLNLAANGLSYDSVITAFFIESEKNENGIPFPRLHMRIERILTPEECAGVKAYSDEFSKLVVPY